MPNFISSARQLHRPEIGAVEASVELQNAVGFVPACSWGVHFGSARTTGREVEAV
jgi:hypothetical protein